MERRQSYRMEKVAAACLMDWSIELEKGLRSRKPGQPIESVMKAGCRLKKWSNGPKLSMVICNMFGLDPGEDRLFVDGMLLRLASAFASGDKDMRICIVKVFKSELRPRDFRSRQKNGIFSTMCVENQKELLRRVIVVLHSGDVESRALTLALFGCLADIVKDIPEIRFAIFSSLISSHVFEVKASLFAAGCICELSDDFAFVFLELLLKMMTSPETLSAVRLAAAQTFGKMWHFPSLAVKSYKVGAQLVLKFSEEDFLTTMLISLTKLASKSIDLISEQLTLLFSFLALRRTSRMQATVLRCIRYIVEKRAFHIPISEFPLEMLFQMLDEADAPSASRCDILHIFLKVIKFTTSDMLLMNMHEFGKLLALVGNSLEPILVSNSERLLAMHILADISRRLDGRVEIMSSGVCSVPHLSTAVSLIWCQITALMNQVLNHCWAPEMEQELKSLLRTNFLLVKDFPELSAFMLDKLCVLVEHVANVHEAKMGTRGPTAEVHNIVQGRSDKNTLAKFMLYLYRFLLACLEGLVEAGVVNSQVPSKLKHLVSFVCRCSLFSCYIHTIYAFLLHSLGDWDCLSSDKRKTQSVDQNLSRSICNSIEDAAVINQCARNMLSGDVNWWAYTAGKHAACMGAWFVCDLIFQQLTSKVKSDVYSCWLKSLDHWSHSERNIQVLFLQGGGSDFVNYITMPSDNKDNYRCIVSPDYIEKLVEACDGLASAEKTLRVIVTSSHAFCFQRWFLALRVKVIDVMVDLLKLLTMLSSCRDGVNSNAQNEEINITDGADLSQQMNLVIYFLERVSFKLRRISLEYDLLASSFIDMDYKSLKVISALASHCSLLAFCIGFTYFVPQSPAWEILTSCSSKGPGNCLHVIVLHNLVGRLRHTDPEICLRLMSLLKADRVHKASFRSQPRFQISNIGCESGNILTACRSAVKGIIDLQNGSMEVHDEDILLHVSKNGTQLLLNMTKEWMCIPFRAPKCFFKVRPSVGALLFSSIAGPKSPNELVVLPGSHLSLNLCLQLENVPPDLTSQLKMIYCILYCKTTLSMRRPHRESIGRSPMDHQAWTTDTMIYLHERLQWYVTELSGQSMKRGDVSCEGKVIEACVCFEKNGTTQRFSTCLLDVSAFPVGSYRIQWLSCCIDSQGSYYSFLPLNPGPVFTVEKPPSCQ
ncbi:hypothetical protein Ancab_015927 [Ancistrocladus abbreviatus]